MTGRFITFEGGEGVGKSTQVKRLAERLRNSGIETVTTREPGGTPGAEAIRGLVVTGEAGRWLPLSETMLFAAARYDHVERVIKPALADEAWVLCDRFADSTLAYQGYGLGQDVATIAEIQEITLRKFLPDLTLILDLEPGAGLARAGQHQRYEAMDIEFHRRLRHGFLAIAEAQPNRCQIVDAGQSIEAVEAGIVDIVNTRFGLDI